MDSDPASHPGFGLMLRTCRLAAGLTQDELAGRSGVSVRAISNMERGRTTRPSLRSVRLLAGAIGLSGPQRERFVSSATFGDGEPDAELGWSRRPGAGPTLSALVPRQLPAAIPHFTGRVSELAVLDGLLDQMGSRAVVISAIGGTAGVGKTALALHWAWQVADHFPDGQLYVNLRGFGPADPLPPPAALRGFLVALHVPAAEIPAGLDAQQGLYRSLLADRKMLIMLDNARDAGQVRPLLPGSSSSVVLVSSRDELAGLVAAEGAWPLFVDVFTDQEARELLARRIGAHRVAAEPAVAGELAELCARLPLALAITAARARAGATLTAVAAQLRDARNRLDALATGEEATDVRAIFSWSYHSLRPPTARMFRLLGLHPGPDVSAAAAASLAAFPPGQASRVLGELIRCHLVAEPVPGRYVLHDLLRVYAAERAHAEDDLAERQAATGRLLDHYLHSCHWAAHLMQPQRGTLDLTGPRPGVTPEQLAGHEQALAWFRAEHQVLLSVTRLAAELGFDACAWQLPWSMATFLDWQGHWDDWAATQRIALAAVTRLGDQAGQATAQRALAAACGRLGEYDEAHARLQECLGLYRQLGDLANESRIHQDLCAMFESQGRYGDALVHAEHALGLTRALADRAGQANALNNIGWINALTGNHERALGFCRQAMDLFHELGLGYFEAHSWDSLGYIEHQLGHFGEATACYARAIDLFRVHGDRLYEARSLHGLGDTREAVGNKRAAAAAWRQALAIFADLRHPDADTVRAKLGKAADPGLSCPA